MASRSVVVEQIRFLVRVSRAC